MEDKNAKPIQKDKNLQSDPKLTQSSSINIEPPKQESVPAPAATPPPVQPSVSIKESESTNVIKPPETTQEKPEFLKHPPKKLDKKEKSKFMGIVLVLSLIISACSIILLLFCIKDTAIPQFIQPAIDYLYKIAQNYL